MGQGMSRTGFHGWWWAGAGRGSKPNGLSGFVTGHLRLAYLLSLAKKKGNFVILYQNLNNFLHNPPSHMMPLQKMPLE